MNFNSYHVILLILGSVTITTVLADTVTVGTYPYQIPGSSSLGLTVASSGNVGIGTTTPGYKLDVVGPVHVGNDLVLTRSDGFQTAAIVTDGVTTPNIALLKAGGGNLATLYLDANTTDIAGNVGIGTTPGYKLDVVGPVHVGNDLVLTRSDGFQTAAIVTDGVTTPNIALLKAGGGDLNNIYLDASKINVDGNIVSSKDICIGNC